LAGAWLPFALLLAERAAPQRPGDGESAASHTTKSTVQLSLQAEKLLRSYQVSSAPPCAVPISSRHGNGWEGAWLQATAHNSTRAAGWRCPALQLSAGRTTERRWNLPLLHRHEMQTRADPRATLTAQGKGAAKGAGRAL